MNDHAILNQHHNQLPPPIVEEMRPGRVRELCRGLTRYDTRVRWGVSEVRRWLSGEDVEVANEVSPNARGVLFGDKKFTTPDSLAEALIEEWKETADTLGFSYPRKRFMEDMVEAFPTKEVVRLRDTWKACLGANCGKFGAVRVQVEWIESRRVPSSRSRCECSGTSRTESRAASRIRTCHYQGDAPCPFQQAGGYGSPCTL